MSFGLRESDLAYIIKAIAHLPEIERAAVFGSRAKGSYRPGSDVDIAIYGEGVTFETLASLHAALEDESPMPYLFDVVDLTHSTHLALKDHVERVGRVIYAARADE